MARVEHTGFESWAGARASVGEHSPRAVESTRLGWETVERPTLEGQILRPTYGVLYTI